ncbi:hypothetical protein [Caldimonas tepidiphila]|uniref:hypothetical protein n=1 Tax=Caldimonas tepidiphila TaxID=2315841 RepID=UPI000E5B84C9|nr:hypothetical protein [Caldimonas tepidiphila]
MTDELNWIEDDELPDGLPEVATIAPLSDRDDRIVEWHGRPGAEVAMGDVFAALKDVYIDTQHYHRHATALIAATMALLPAEPEVHPALLADPDAEHDDPRERARRELRESISHVRTLMGETLRYMSEEFKSRVDSEADRAGVWTAAETEKAAIRRLRDES